MTLGDFIGIPLHESQCILFNYKNKFTLVVCVCAGYFYAAEQADESVLGLCTNSNNSLLVTGDTTGQIRVWDIMAHCTGFQDRGVRLIYFVFVSQGW